MSQNYYFLKDIRRFSENISIIAESSLASLDPDTDSLEDEETVRIIQNLRECYELLHLIDEYYKLND